MFDAIKIKEEPVDNDLEEVSGRKYEPYSKDKFLQVKLEPLDQDVLKRLCHGKVNDKGKTCVNRVNSICSKGNNLQAEKQLLYANGKNIATNRNQSSKRGGCSNANLLEGPPSAVDASADLKTPHSSQEVVLKWDDLRHLINSHNEADHGSSSMEASDEEEVGSDEENELDSMSIHADEDDLDVGSHEELNKLGKPFAASHSDETQEEILCDPGKRKICHEKDHSETKRQMTNQFKEISSSVSPADSEANRDTNQKRDTQASPGIMGNGKNEEWNSGGAGKPMTDRNGSDRMLNNRVDVRAPFLSGQNRPRELRMKTPIVQNREHERETWNAREGILPRPDYRRQCANFPPRMMGSWPNSPGGTTGNLVQPSPRFQPNQPRFQLNQPRFQSNQPRFQSNQPRFQLNQPQFGGNHHQAMNFPLQCPRNQEKGRNLRRPEDDVCAAGQRTPAVLESMTCGTRLRHVLLENDFGSCVDACNEIISQGSRIHPNVLEELIRKAANDDVKNLNAETISCILDLIRKERRKTGFRVEDFMYSIEAFVKVEDSNSAIEVVLEMQNHGFKPQKSKLLLVRNAIFVSSLHNADSLIRFCDVLEAEAPSLINEKLLEEILKFVPIEELKAKTKSSKVHEILQQRTRPEGKPAPTWQPTTPTLQPTTPTPIDDVAQLLKHMETFYTDENIPPHLVHRLIGSIKEPSHALAVIKKLPQLPKDVLVSVPSEVWNDFFIQTCNGPLTNVQYANQVHGIISDNDIPVLNKTLLMFAMLLLKDGTRATCKAAMEIIGRIQLDDVTENDVTDELSEFIASYVGSEKLHSVLDSYRIVRILIKSKRFLMEEKLISVVDSLRREACYQEIYDIIVELKKADVIPSLQLYQLAGPALEDWEDAQQPFFDVLKWMKQSYPKTRLFKDDHHQLDSAGSCASISSASISSPTEHSLISMSTAMVGSEGTRSESSDMCNFFIAKMPCPNGSRCRFMHHVPAMPLRSPFEEMLNNRQSHLVDEFSTATSSSLVGHDSCGVQSESDAPEAALTETPELARSPSMAYRQFYNSVVFASKSSNFNDVCRLYVKMRDSKVAVGDVILLEIFKALVQDDSINRYEKLVMLVKEKIPQIQAVPEDDEELEELLILHNEDQENLGRLGVALLFRCIERNEMSEAFSLLNLFHKVNINYSYYGVAFDDNHPDRTKSQIAMAAVKVCLCQCTPNLEGAIEVLRAADFGVPSTNEDDTERKSLLVQLVDGLLNDEEYEYAYEVVTQSDNSQGWSLDAGCYFNKVLLRLSEGDFAAKAAEVFSLIEKYNIEKDKRSFRAFLNCHTRAKNMETARKLFEMGRQMEIYPWQERSDPFVFECPCNLTQTEMLFMLEEHLQKAKKRICTDSCSTMKPLMEAQNAFRIVFKENYELFETSEEQIATAKENMTFVLAERMKPKLKIVETENPDEPLVIGASSILGWYKGRSALHPQLSITSTTDSRSVQRTVNVLGSENAFQPHSNGETSADVTENTVTRQDNSTESLSVKNDAVPAVHRRVMHYWRCGKVANKHDCEECCIAIIKTFCKKNKVQSFESKEILTSYLHSFVDRFFEKHVVFKPKR